MIQLLTHNEHDRFSIQSELALATADKLAVAVAQLRSENNFLRRKLKVRPQTRMLQQAAAGARLLALWHCTGYRTGRMTALSFGMSERTWFAARALCLAARIHDGIAFTTDEPNDIEKRLALALAKCEQNISCLVSRLPLSRRPRWSA